MRTSPRARTLPFIAILAVLSSLGILMGAVTVINLATQVTGLLPAANGGTNADLHAAGSGTYPKANGSGTYAASTLAAAGIGSCTNQVATALNADAAPTCTTVSNTLSNSSIVGFAAISNTVINPSATTDTKLSEFALPAGYLNASAKSLNVFAKIIQSTGTTQTPTVTYKLKLCTVSGCGSGTVLVLATFGASAAMTASTNETTIIQAAVGTAATGATGTVETGGFALINVSSTTGLATGAVLWNDTNNAVSSTIDLTAALFLDVMGQFSTQSGTKNGMVARIVTASPVL